METARKPGTAGVPYDQRLAAILVRPLARTPIRPNHLTLLGLLFAASSGLVLAGGSQFGWAAFLFMCAVLTDHADGELARLTGRSSRFGHHLDYLAGAASYTMMYLGAGIGLSQGQGPLGTWALGLGIVAAVANPLVMIVRLINERRHGEEAVAHPYFWGFEIEDFIYLIGPFAWIGAFDAFFVIFGLGAIGYLAWQVTDLMSRDLANRNRSARQRVPRPGPRPRPHG